MPGIRLCSKTDSSFHKAALARYFPIYYINWITHDLWSKREYNLNGTVASILNNTKSFEFFEGLGVASTVNICP